MRNNYQRKDRKSNHNFEVVRGQEFLVRVEGLEVNHMKPRSRLGDDVMHNLITLCVRCHGKCHGGRR